MAIMFSSRKTTAQGLEWKLGESEKIWPYKGDSLDLEVVLPAAEPVSAFPTQIQNEDILKEICQSGFPQILEPFKPTA